MITKTTIYQIMLKTSESLQAMLQVKKARVEEQATQMAYFTIQTQELRTQLDNMTIQLATLQKILQQLTSTNGNNNTNNRIGNDNRDAKHHNTKSTKQK